MSVGITVGSLTNEIGTPSFLHAFFSTVSVHCEPRGWGSRYPYLMNYLYQGHLSAKYALAALNELLDAKGQLSKLPPSAVVWDIEDRSAQPPWGKDIAPTITSLGNYFLSSTGRDLFELLEESLAASSAKNSDAVID